MALIMDKGRDTIQSTADELHYQKKKRDKRSASNKTEDILAKNNAQNLNSKHKNRSSSNVENNM